jgi:hypothetical protein
VARCGGRRSNPSNSFQKSISRSRSGGRECHRKRRRRRCAGCRKSRSRGPRRRRGARSCNWRRRRRYRWSATAYRKQRLEAVFESVAELGLQRLVTGAGAIPHDVDFTRKVIGHCRFAKPIQSCPPAAFAPRDERIDPIAVTPTDAAPERFVERDDHRHNDRLRTLIRHRGERLIHPAIARLIRRELIGVVENGPGRRPRRAHVARRHCHCVGERLRPLKDLARLSRRFSTTELRSSVPSRHSPDPIGPIGRTTGGSALGGFSIAVPTALRLHARRASSTPRH